MFSERFSAYPEMMVKERYAEMLQAAELERLVHQSGAPRRSRRTAALSWLGRQLVSAGSWLQDRYAVAGGAVADFSVADSALMDGAPCRGC